MSKIRVLVIDDCPVMRTLLPELLATDPGIEVVGTAEDAYAARESIKILQPDVLTLDVEMPKMNGLKFLANLMRLRPMPVIMVSALTQECAAVTMQALELGAVDFVPKPLSEKERALPEFTSELTSKVKVAAVVPRHLLAMAGRRSAEPSLAGQPVRRAAADAPSATRITSSLIAIGASTGGTEAIKEVLMQLSPSSPSIVVTQHIPPFFSRSFAERMNHYCSMPVYEAQDGQEIHAGGVYIAPGDRHFSIQRGTGKRLRCRIANGERVSMHRPSVDVLFDSVAQQIGGAALGVILTGMGRDGAAGLKQMHDAGAHTIAQDEDSSVVWGMPQAAVEQGGVDRVLSLDAIVAQLSQVAAA